MFPVTAPAQRSTRQVATTVGTQGVIDLSRPNGAARTPVQTLVSLVGAAGLMLLVPFVILLVGMPIVLAVRGFVELLRWLSGVFG